MSELIILILLLIFIFITIFRFYIENQKLKDRLRELSKEAIKLRDNNKEIKAKNEILSKNSLEIDRLKEVEREYNQLLGKNSKLEEELKELQKINSEYREKIEEFNAMKERLNALNDSLKEKEELIKNLKEQMSSEFKNLSNELLQKSQENLQKNSKEQIKTILEPFDKELKEFKDTINKIHNHQNSSINMLRGELTQLKELNQNLSKEAKELADALKNSNKIQGNWGELILERALEASGLRKDIEYKREVELKDNNKSFRADVVIYLPEGKHLIIDSKVSLSNYIGVIKAKDEQSKKLAKTKLLLSIKRHIDTLAQKRYHLMENMLTPEFTLMFIPIEAAFSIALEQDNTLLEYAMQKGVSIVTPTTLFATLKSIATIWRLSNHDKNMEQLAKEAGSLHYKFALFLEDFNKIEARLKQAYDSWEGAKLKLSTGQGSLYSKIQRVGELSGRAKKELPIIKESN